MTDHIRGVRGFRGRAFTLLTPGNHYASRLPEFPGVRIVKLVTPRLAPARFAQYLLELPAGARSQPTAAGFEHFLFGLDGEAAASLPDQHFFLGDGGFAYVPATLAFELHAGATGPARVLWLKRRYEALAGIPAPEALGRRRADIESAATAVPGLSRAELLPPDDPAFDFNMTLMSFDPNVGLPQIEIHDEEHGLYMTAGAGRYYLDGEDHEVKTDDFIYMAPFCPQSFAAHAAGAEYLLYKDVHRDGF